MNNDRLELHQKIAFAKDIFDRPGGLIRYASDKHSPYYGKSFIVVNQEPIGAARSLVLKYVRINHMIIMLLLIDYVINVVLRVPTKKVVDPSAREALKQPPAPSNKDKPTNTYVCASPFCFMQTSTYQSCMCVQ